MPRKRPGPTVGLRLLSGGVSLNKASSTTLLPVRLQWAAERHEGTALLDSGAEGNLLDISLAQLLHIPLVPLRHKISVSALNGQSLPPISLSTVPITLVTFRQPLRDHHVPRHPLTPGPGGVGSPLAHTAQSSGGLGSAHRVGVESSLLCLLSCVCWFFCV